jgi:uncharacterized protein (TIGR04255 family)
VWKGSPVTEKIPARRPLKKKPLIEAIFELRWDLVEGPKQGLKIDPAFRIFTGRYYDQIKTRYPHFQELPASEVPEAMVPYVARHQFWTGKGQWPVTQIGPGLLSVNETDGYLWDSFRPLLVDAFNALFKSYPTELVKLRVNQLELRYIDSVQFIPEQSKVAVLPFLLDSLHTRIDIDPILFADDPKRADSPSAVTISLTYPTSKPKGHVMLSMGNGLKGELPSIIWETKVTSVIEGTTIDLPGFEHWLDEAHAVSDEWFFALVRGKLLDSFE